jgi:hypothetical protein
LIQQDFALKEALGVGRASAERAYQFIHGFTAVRAGEDRNDG